MLQVNFIKNNRQEIIERLAIKNFTDIPLIDLIVQLDSERKSLQFEHDEIQSKINAASREIGELMLLFILLIVEKGKHGRAFAHLPQKISKISYCIFTYNIY